MEIKYEEIAKEIISLYCENKPKKVPRCINKECQSERCLCIDEEQIRLVSFFAGFSYDIRLKDSQVVIEGNEKLKTDIFCKNQKEFTRRLIACKGMNPDDLETLILNNKEYLNKQSFFKIIRVLPLIQSINALYPVEERSSISYLCLYGSEAGSFLKGLLSVMVCQMIDGLICDRTSETLLHTAEKIFEKITRIYKGEEADTFESTFVSNIVGYIDDYRRESQSLDLIADNLSTYHNDLKEWENSKEKSKDACSFILKNAVIDKTDILHTYSIFRKLTIITGQKCSDVLEKFFKKSIKHKNRHNIYDGIEDILKKFSKYDTDTQHEVLHILKDMFSKENGICDEMFDILKNVVL